MKMMELNYVNKVYKKNNDIIEALVNIKASFEKGKFYAIMGHSGSGKSTLIRILGLMDNCTNGKYMLNAQDVAKLNDKELSDLRMKEIGFVFQNFYLDQYMSAIENVILPMLINKEIKKEDRIKRAEELLNKVGLIDRKNHFPKEMSGGEQQRVCIARALSNNPSIILADEPTGNLDEKNEQIIFDYLKKLTNEGKCVIVVSHSETVKDYADIVLNLSNGELM